MRVISEQVIAAVRSGYEGTLPGDKCSCGGTIEVTHTKPLAGWVLRRLKCKACGTKAGKWMAKVSATE